MRKLFAFLIFCVLLNILFSAHATDLPIDVDTITSLEEEQKEAVTKRRGIDLFSNTAGEVSKALDLRHEATRAEAQDSIFGAPKVYYYTEPTTLIARAADSAGLFSEPLRFTTNVLPEEAVTTQMWVYILLFIGASGVGLLFAMLMAARKKELAQSVHNNHD